jgi:hypothetical protein
MREVALFRAANYQGVMGDLVPGILAIAERQRDRIRELERVLRMVKADRPSAHSDDVWTALLEVLGDA